MSFRDKCKEIKARVKIERVAHKLLSLTPEQDKSGNRVYRAPCPGCNAGDQRAIIITPHIGVYFCFPAHVGGSVIDLVAHVKNVSTQDAVEYLESFDEEPKEEKTNGFDVIKYRESLNTEHELLQKTGLSKEMCVALGLGVASKGVHRGRIAIPLFDHHGNFLVYASTSDIQLPKNWRP